MSTIESVLQETRLFSPRERTVAAAAISGMGAYRLLVAEAEEDYEGFWARLRGQTLSWKMPFRTVLNETDAPFYRWFEDGELNSSYNCLDRHVQEGRGAARAIISKRTTGPSAT